MNDGMNITGGRALRAEEYWMRSSGRDFVTPNSTCAREGWCCVVVSRQRRLYAKTCEAL